MRLGFFIGFLIGAAIATVLSRPERAEAPGEEEAVAAPTPAQAEGIVARLKRQSQAARQAAREAAAEKEQEMLRDWERSRHHEA